MNRVHGVAARSLGAAGAALDLLWALAAPAGWLALGLGLAWLGWCVPQGEPALWLWGPALVLARCATQVMALALGYYGLALFWVPEALVRFLQPWQELSLAAAALLVLLQALLNAAPWALAAWWAHKLVQPGLRALLKCGLGSALALLPPLDVWSWAHPLMVAGDWFWGQGVCGLLATVLLWAAVGEYVRCIWMGACSRARRCRALAAMLLCGVLAGALAYHAQQQRQRSWKQAAAQWAAVLPVPSQWQALVPNDLPKRLSWAVAQLQQAWQTEDLQHALLVWPEGVLGPWRPSLQAAGQRWAHRLGQRHMRALWSAELACDQSQAWLDAQARQLCLQPDARRYHVVWLLDEHGVRPVYAVRRPVPLAWLGPAFSHPAPSLAWSSPIVSIDAGRSVALLVCYESFLLSSWIRVMLANTAETASISVVMANMWFASEQVRRIQQVAVRRGAALAGVWPVISVNGG
ncbi:MAG: hypothetical protein N2690_00225 [Rhodocyclaceae bacterium]|nr:hypothetical protein [Rhodocyclaceae bacterium]